SYFPGPCHGPRTRRPTAMAYAWLSLQASVLYKGEQILFLWPLRGGNARPTEGFPRAICWKPQHRSKPTELLLAWRRECDPPAAPLEQYLWALGAQHRRSPTQKRGSGPHF